MSASESPALLQEWAVLQGNIEQHERNALAVKIAAVLVFFAALVFSLAETLVAALVTILWVQEALLRTFQARLCRRILRVEELLRGQSVGQAMQLHTEWTAGRRGVLGMIAEYAKCALRPTVAFPYVALLVLDLIFLGGAGAGIEMPPA